MQLEELETYPLDYYFPKSSLQKTNYVGKFHSLLPKEVVSYIYQYAFMAGGSVASRLLNIGFSDYDFYFRNRNDFETFSAKMEKCCGVYFGKGLLYRINYNSGFVGYTLMTIKDDLEEMYDPVSYKVDSNFHSIGFLCGTPMEVISSFDLSCCQAAYDPKTYRFITTPAFEHSLKTKRGTIEHFTTPLKTATRVLKYITRGITFSYSELLKIHMALETDPMSPTPTQLINPFERNYNTPSLSKELALEYLEKEMEKADD